MDKPKIKKPKLTIAVDNHFNNQYKNFFETEFDLEVLYMRDLVTGKLPDIDFAFFTGGADVNPDLYGQSIGKYTSIDKNRDIEEEDFFHKFRYIPKLGICRGSQFLSVMSGASLIQHVEGHASGTLHSIDVNNNSSFDISSTHHQMMYPFKLNRKKYELIGWSSYYLSNTYLDGENKEMNISNSFLEPEIVYYKDTKSLCIQGHPEMANVPASTKKLCINLIKNYLLKL